MKDKKRIIVIIVYCDSHNCNLGCALKVLNNIFFSLTHVENFKLF